jgi:hypothetical protein
MKRFNEKYETLIVGYQLDEGILQSIGQGFKNLGMGIVNRLGDAATKNWRELTGNVKKIDVKSEISNIEKIVRNDPNSIKIEGIPNFLTINGKTFQFKRENVITILKNPNFKNMPTLNFLDEILIAAKNIGAPNILPLIKSEILSKDLSSLAQITDESDPLYKKVYSDVQKKLQEKINPANTIDKNTAFKILYKLLLLSIILELQK